MRQKRKFYLNAFQHIYIRSKDCGVIFYTIEDYLVLFSIISTLSKKMNVKIISQCYMINHIHLLIYCEDEELMSKFMQRVISLFVKEYNENISRKGPLFSSAFGSASKSGEKAIRNIISYILNNPIEKSLCNKAEEYKWNFIAYSISKNPFSTKLNRKDMTKSLRYTLDTVTRQHKENKYLSYELLNYLFKQLPSHKDTNDNSDRLNLLIDHIISTYNNICYNVVYKYFKDYKTLNIALASSTGKEYDIKEDWDNHPDNIYSKLIDLTQELGYLKYRGNFKALKPKELKFLIHYLQNNTSANDKQISRFLHIEDL